MSENTKRRPGWVWLWAIVLLQTLYCLFLRSQLARTETRVEQLSEELRNASHLIAEAQVQVHRLQQDAARRPGAAPDRGVVIRPIDQVSDAVP